MVRNGARPVSVGPGGRAADGGVPPGARDGVRALLAARPFRRLLVAQAISSVGDWVGTVAIIAQAFDLTGSPTAVGGVLVLRLLPPLLAGPVGGVLADRLDRRRVMVTTNLVMGLLIGLVPFTGLTGLYLIALSSESLALLFLPARDASVPRLVPGRLLSVANGLIMGSSYGAIPVAAALFSGLRVAALRVPGWVPLADLLHDHPLAVPFLFDGGTFVLAAALIATIPATNRSSGGTLNLLAGLSEAFRYARRSAWIRALAAGVGVAMVGGGVLFALGLAYVRETLGGGDVEFGFLTSLWGVGMAAGVGGVRLVARRGEGRAFRRSVAVCGAVLVGMAALPFLWLAFVAAVVFGAAFSVALVLAMTIVQRGASEHLRGRLVAGAHLLFRAGLAAGALGIGGLAGAVRYFSLELGPVPVALDGNRLGLLVAGAIILAGAAFSGGVSGRGAVYVRPGLRGRAAGAAALPVPRSGSLPATSRAVARACGPGAGPPCRTRRPGRRLGRPLPGHAPWPPGPAAAPSRPLSGQPGAQVTWQPRAHD